MKPLDREILRLALPSIVSNITVPLLGLCDVTIMGHIGGATHIGALAVGSMIFNVMYWLFVFLRMSTSGLTAQAYGAADGLAMRQALRRSLTMALAWGVGLVVLQVPLRHVTFWLMQAEGQVAALCTPYFNICIWGAPAVLGLYALTGWLVGMQNTRIPMLIAIGQNVVNIALSLTLVVGFHMGIHGVALGTVVAQWAGFLVGLWMVAHSFQAAPPLGGRPPAPESVSPPRGSWGGLFIFLRTLCLVSVNLYFTSAGSAQGPLILAANTLLMQLFMLYSYVMDGFASAGEALSGRFLGAGDALMLRSTVRRLFGWGLLMALLFTAAYAAGGCPLLGLLTSDADVVAVATRYLPWAVLIPLAGMAAFIWDGIYIGTTRSRGMLAACAGAAAVFFAWWLLMGARLHNHALWQALLLYLLLRGLIQTALWHQLTHPRWGGRDKQSGMPFVKRPNCCMKLLQMSMQVLAVLCLALLVSAKGSAQSGVWSMVRKVGTQIDSMSVRGLDRRYIDAPERPWQIIARGNMNQSLLSMKTEGTIAGYDYKARPRLKTEPSRYVGLWAGYRGYGLGYTVNVGGDRGSYLTLGATGGAYGINVRIHSFENSSPNFDLNSAIIPDEEKDEWSEVQLTDPIKVHTVIADGYYLFNGRRFSYAAAYDQSVLQKQSAGSLMAGAMYYYGSIDYASPTNGDLIYLMQGLGRVKLWQGSVGVGYAYNWVPVRGLLVSAMAMPMLTFVNRIRAYGYTTNMDELMQNPTFWDEEMDADDWDAWLYGNLRIAPMGEKTFNSGMTVNLDARLSVTYNFGRYFINAYGQLNNMRYRHRSSRGSLSDWYANASIGVRF